MATFDAYYPKESLRKCPFNSNHRVKDSKYMKHIQSCEQSFPKQKLNVNRKDNGSNGGKHVLGSSLESLDSALTDSLSSSAGTTAVADDASSIVQSMKSMTIGNKETDDNEGSTLSDDNQTVDTEVTADSAIEMASNDGLNEDLTQEINADNPMPSTSRHETQRPLPSSSQLVPKHVIQEIDGQQETAGNDTAKGDGSGDNDDNWDQQSGPTFSLYNPNIDYNNLTDNQIREMRDNFTEPAIISRMSKQQRKRVYDKLKDLTNEGKNRTLRALEDLMALRDACDPELDAIPQEIRKPRVHIRDLFKLKDMNNRLAKTQFNDDSTGCLSTAATADNSNDHELAADKATESQSTSAAVSCGKELSIESEPISGQSLVLDTKCNSCSSRLSLSDTNIKRLTVFCGDCSSTKFGGYFECHSCHLYGYFAKSQIVSHLAQHFPQTLVQTNSS